ATLDGKSLRISLETGGRAFTVAYSTTSSDGTFTTEETPFEKRLAEATITLSEDLDHNGTVAASETLKPGEVWAIVVDGIDFSYITQKGDTPTTVAQKLAEQINTADAATTDLNGGSAGGRSVAAA